MKNNVLVLGSGAREHAIAWKLDQSPLVDNVYIAPGNACKFSVNKSEIPNLENLDIVRAFIEERKISLVVIGPEKEICDGWADKLKDLCHVFSPNLLNSQLEGSKWYAKEFMIANQLPTAKYAAFTSLRKAIDFVNTIEWERMVIKEDGLCAGKGVTIAENKLIASQLINDLFFNKPDSSIIIEECLEGFEISALCFSDGLTIREMPLSQDHKRALEGDKGENTGGMGAIAPIILSNELTAEIKDILQRTINALNLALNPYKGVLYAGLMITSEGPKILEYNCRFGDPETEVILRLLKTDLYEIFEACCTGKLDQIDVKWSSKYCIGITMAAKGYPGEYPTGLKISDIPEDNEEENVTFYAGANIIDGELVNTGGRVLCVTCLNISPFLAKSKCLQIVDKIKFAEKHFRRDIGDFVLYWEKEKLDYAKSGVNIEEGNEFINEIKEYCSKTLILGTEEIGGFGAVVNLSRAGFSDSVSLVIGMDGIGTKIELAAQNDMFDGLGYDLVGMCANDVLCHAARPIAFLDYYVTGKLNNCEAARIVKSISEACIEAGCALVGGETAEMPGVYALHQWDLAGCCIAARETTWPKLPQDEKLQPGDILLGISSNGLHSNGFSLVRKVLSSCGIDPAKCFCPWDKNKTLAEELLKPTQIYVKSLMDLVISGKIKAMAHITGGGIVENLPRCLPPNLGAYLDCNSWDLPPIFRWLKQFGAINSFEMFKTFNCGLGLILVVSLELVEEIQTSLTEHSLESYNIGHIVEYNPEKPIDRIQLKNMDYLFDGYFFDAEYVHRQRINVAILISGAGTNMSRLIEQTRKRNSHCHISVVISNNANALGVNLAKSMGIDSIVIPHGKCREEFEKKINQELEQRNIELICLAGFMRILTEDFIKKWHKRIINIHPSLLPSFKGANAVKQALEAGVKVTGCTVHYVIEDIDAGEILGQEIVYVEDSDNEESLLKKIHTKEHILFPKMMEKVAKSLLK